ncbi:hypothetical protein SAMD00023353_2200680 [Rosellinia necatrix]|uniref:Uncharacterized protein n=1 Tax=Rosellinia necatrix TaxID=77044 RepID=A0A1S8A885_ROSNE|nr:hypothetical protein SAMD00023353_2200680 [Rosellinia necatrix]
MPSIDDQKVTTRGSYEESYKHSYTHSYTHSYKGSYYLLPRKAVARYIHTSMNQN